jgi:hypothetical protein
MTKPGRAFEYAKAQRVKQPVYRLSEQTPVQAHVDAEGHLALRVSVIPAAEVLDFAAWMLVTYSETFANEALAHDTPLSWVKALNRQAQAYLEIECIHGARLGEARRHCEKLEAENAALRKEIKGFKTAKKRK